MKSPPIVYFLCALAWIGMIFLSLHFLSGKSSGVGTTLAIFVMFILSLYFSFFTVKRFRYDRIRTGKSRELVREVEMDPDATVKLFQIEGARPVRINLNLLCKRYESDEEFPLQIVDSKGTIIAE